MWYRWENNFEYLYGWLASWFQQIWAVERKEDISLMIQPNLNFISQKKLLKKPSMGWPEQMGHNCVCVRVSHKDFEEELIFPCAAGFLPQKNCWTSRKHKRSPSWSLSPWSQQSLARSVDKRPPPTPRSSQVRLMQYLCLFLEEGNGVENQKYFISSWKRKVKVY